MTDDERGGVRGRRRTRACERCATVFPVTRNNPRKRFCTLRCANRTTKAARARGDCERVLALQRLAPPLPPAPCGFPEAITHPPERALVVAILSQAVLDAKAYREHAHRRDGACLCAVARHGQDAEAFLADVTSEAPWSVRWCLAVLALGDLRALRSCQEQLEMPRRRAMA